MDSQQIVADVLDEVVKSFEIPVATITDRFSDDLQANSVSVLRLLVNLQERFDITIDVVDMFLAETVSDLVVLVEGSLSEN